MTILNGSLWVGYGLVRVRALTFRTSSNLHPGSNLTFFAAYAP